VLAALERGGGLATYALASDALRADVDAFRGNGSRLADPSPGERLRPDGRTVRWLISLPMDLGPDRTPFLIEHDPAGAEWTAEERAERAAARYRLGGAVRLTTLEISTPDVAALGYAYLRDLGLRFRPSLAGHGARDASVGSQTIRLRPGRVVQVGDREPRGNAEWAVIRLRADTDTRRDVTLLGCRWLVNG
jgi:hypothetical protein